MAYDWNAALRQLNYEEATPRPGETSTAFYARKQREFDADRQQQTGMTRYIQDLQRQQQQQGQFQSGLQQAGLMAPSGSSGSGFMFGGTDQQAELDKQEMQRLRAQSFGELDQEKNWWDTDQNAVEVRNSLQGQMRGQDVPFTEMVQQGMIGQSQDANAAALAQENQLIRQRMANQGLSGGGGELSAMVQSQRQTSAAQRAASRDIRTRAELENFQARERARQEVSQLMAREAAQRMQATNKAADLRSQLEINRTQENTANTEANAALLAGGGVPTLGQRQVPTLPAGLQGMPLTGNGQPQASYGGVTYLGGSGVQPFRQTSGNTGYRNFGLGGSAGPWGAISDANDIASANMGWSQASYNQVGARGSAAQNAANSRWDQLQANAVDGSAHARGSAAHNAWNGEQRRFSNPGANRYLA